MFTGIAQGKASIRRLEPQDGRLRLTVAFPEGALEGAVEGASVAINGCCLTIEKTDGDEAVFCAVGETLRLTNLGALKEGDEVNFERAAKIGDEIGGHRMAGHIQCTVKTLEVTKNGEDAAMRVELPFGLEHYFLEKAFVGLNGCSLTVSEVGDDDFTVNLVPETLKRTTFGSVEAGSVLNLEIDMFVQAVVDSVGYAFFCEMDNLVPAWVNVKDKKKGKRKGKKGKGKRRKSKKK